MRLKILLFTVGMAALTGCSSTYKSGQTPDDLYFSPVQTSEENNTREEEEGVKYRSAENREIRMSRYDRRWRDFDDDFNCHYDPYRYGYAYGYYYNPYYYPSPVFISGSPVLNPKNTTPRMTNLGSYNYSNMVVVNPKSGVSKYIKTERRYNNSNNSSYIRRVITPTHSSENNTRTYNPSSGSSSGGNSSGAPVSRPGRN